MYKKYGKQAEFFVVYIREAHASDGERPGKDDVSKKITEPKTLLERTKNASACIDDLKIDMPCLIDDMKNSTEKNWDGWPDRLFLVNREGTIAFRGDQGPRGFKPTDLEEALKKVLK